MRMLKQGLAALAAATLLAAGSPEATGQPRMSEQMRRHHEQMRDRMMQGRMQMQDEARESTRDRQAGGFDLEQRYRLQGTLTHLRTTLLEDTQRRFTLGRLQLNDGRVVRVALGPPDQLQPLGLREGGSLIVEGSEGFIGGQSYLVADEIEATRRFVNVEQPEAVFRRTDVRSGRQARPDSRYMQFEGEVIETTRARQGLDQQVTLAWVRDDRGRVRTITLGTPDALQEIELSPGDEMSVLVREATVGGQDQLLALAFESEGRTHRTDLPQRLGRPSQPSSQPRF